VLPSLSRNTADLCDATPSTVVPRAQTLLLTTVPPTPRRDEANKLNDDLAAKLST